MKRTGIITNVKTDENLKKTDVNAEMRNSVGRTRLSGGAQLGKENSVLAAGVFIACGAV